MTANKPMTGEQLDELMTVAVNMQRDSEKQGDRPTAMFAYAVQVAVLELRKVRADAAKKPETSMSITRYWISPNGIACEDESGSFVKYEDYAAIEKKLAESQREFRAADATIENLQMQVEKLAAENAGLKEWSPNPHSASMFEAIEKAEALMDDGMPELAMIEAFEILKMKRTPATDDFLAEVRAQAKADGVQEYADSFRHSASKIRECHGDTIRVRALLHEANNADEFASQIRKGVQS